ncbi:MAG: hypothetical protein AB8G96_13750 [Phycisphaerales bacterium]
MSRAVSPVREYEEDAEEVEFTIHRVGVAKRSEAAQDLECVDDVERADELGLWGGVVVPISIMSGRRGGDDGATACDGMRRGNRGERSWRAGLGFALGVGRGQYVPFVPIALCGELARE